MIEHFMDTGTHGELRIRDFTDESSYMMVDFAIRTKTVFTDQDVLRQLSWSWWMDDEQADTNALDFDPAGEDWRMLAEDFGGGHDTASLRLQDSMTTELGGPTELTIGLYGSPNTVHGLVDVKHGGIWVKAIPFVRDSGVWKQATPLVRSQGTWKELGV